jgi:hypothetical protein
MVGTVAYRIMGNRIMANRELLLSREASRRWAAKMAGGGGRPVCKRVNPAHGEMAKRSLGDGGPIANGVGGQSETRLQGVHPPRNDDGGPIAKRFFGAVGPCGGRKKEIAQFTTADHCQVATLDAGVNATPWMEKELGTAATVANCLALKLKFSVDGAQFLAEVGRRVELPMLDEVCRLMASGPTVSGVRAVLSGWRPLRRSPQVSLR